MFLDRNKLHFFMAYGKLPWLLLLLYPLCELNMYSVACCLRCYCRVTYGTDSIRMKLALDNPSDYMHSSPFFSLAAAAVPDLLLSVGHGLHYLLSSLPRQRWAVGGNMTGRDCLCTCVWGTESAHALGFVSVSCFHAPPAGWLYRSHLSPPLSS